jgi:integrase
MATKRLTDISIKAFKAGADRYEVPDAGCKGLLLIVHKTGSKSWAMRFRRPGGKLAKLTLGSYPNNDKAVTKAEIGSPMKLAEAHAVATDINLKRKNGVDVVQKYVKAKRHEIDEKPVDLTFPAAVLAFAKHAESTTRRWRETVRMLGLDFPLDGVEPTVVRDGLYERWAKKLVAEITKKDINELIREAVSSGIPGLGRGNDSESNARGRKMSDALKAIFKFMFTNQDIWLIEANPCDGSYRPAKAKKRRRFLNSKLNVRGADEFRFVWAATDKVGEPFGTFVKMLLLTGARREEIARMSETEVSDDFSMLALPEERTKNKLPHNIPLPPMARSLIKKINRKCEFFFSTNGRTPISGFSKYKKRLDELVTAEAGTEIPNWTLHDCRRTVSTGMNGIGILPHVVEAVLNHVSGASKDDVAGTYNLEAYDPEKKIALNKWARHIEGIVSGRKEKTSSQNKFLPGVRRG